MTADDFVKIALGAAFAISLLGISIQLMRVLGTFNGILQDFRYVGWKLAKGLEMIVDDYSKLRTRLRGIGGSLTKMQKGFVEPVTQLVVTLGTAAKLVNKFIKGNDE